MKCRECGSEMELDDKDFNFKGNYDNYWICKNHPVSCIEQVRFGQSFKESWHMEFGNEVKDFEIKKPIEAKYFDGERTMRRMIIPKRN